MMLALLLTTAICLSLAGFRWFLLVLRVFLWKNMLGGLDWSKNHKNWTYRGRRVFVCGDSAGSPSWLEFLLRLTCTEKDDKYNGRKIAWNGKWEGTHRRGFRVLAVATPGFARGFRFTRHLFCSNMATGRLEIEFPAGRGDFYFSWRSDVALVRRRPGVGLLLRRLVFLRRRQVRLGLGFPCNAMFLYLSRVDLSFLFASTWSEKGHPIVACLGRLRRWIWVVHCDWSHPSDRALGENASEQFTRARMNLSRRIACVTSRVVPMSAYFVT